MYREIQNLKKNAGVCFEIVTKDYLLTLDQPTNST
jgi:hypothetical protein